jgi:hypothetical protein
MTGHSDHIVNATCNPIAVRVVCSRHRSSVFIVRKVCLSAVMIVLPESTRASVFDVPRLLGGQTDFCARCRL